MPPAKTFAGGLSLGDLLLVCAWLALVLWYLLDELQGKLAQLDEKLQVQWDCHWIGWMRRTDKTQLSRPCISKDSLDGNSKVGKNKEVKASIVNGPWTGGSSASRGIHALETFAFSEVHALQLIKAGMLLQGGLMFNSRVTSGYYPRQASFFGTLKLDPKPGMHMLN
eukprot:1158159-Pelagomonas_calceolata.AAC.4